MTTSGSYNLNYNLNEVIEEAFDLLQVGQDGETLSGDMFKRCRTTLNTMLKAWEAQGIHLWTYQEGALFLEKGKATYDFGDSSVHLANTYYETSLDENSSSGDTTINVKATSNLSNSDPIGVVMNNDKIHWSTVSSFVSDDTITLNDALTDDADSGSEVYYYSNTETFKPVSRILPDGVRRKDGDTEVPISFVSREDYDNLPNKSQEGTVVQAHYARQIPDGVMYVWNAPSSAAPVLKFTYERKIQIMEDATDTFDVPEYWFEALIWNLARRLIPKYGCSQARAAEIRSGAQEALNDALGYDTAVYPISVDMRQWY